MNIKCVKLISGEEVIADVNDSIEGLVILKNPLLLMMVPSQNNQFAMGLGPFCAFAKDGEVPIMAGAIISIFEPETGLRNEYNSKYGSGIVLPETKLVI